MTKSVAVECRWPLAVLAARHCAQISSDLRPCCLDRARYIHTPLTWDEPLLCQFWPVSFSCEQTANFTFMIHMNYMCAVDQNKLTNLKAWSLKQLNQYRPQLTQYSVFERISSCRSFFNLTSYSLTSGVEFEQGFLKSIGINQPPKASSMVSLFAMPVASSFGGRKIVHFFHGS